MQAFPKRPFSRLGPPDFTSPYFSDYHARSMSNAPIHRHIIAALVTNEPGVLAQVAGMFAARGFNIDSLVVGRTENPELSRMTIVVLGTDAILEQVRKQLEKLVAVVTVADYRIAAVVERDLALVSIATAKPGVRTEVLQLTELFRGAVVDVAADSIIVKLEGTEEKISAFLDLVRPFGILDMARTGVIAMARGSGKSARAKAALPGAKKDDAHAIDLSALPPG